MLRRALVFVALLAASSALAADGVLEINQTCAEGPGCFPGDSSGFPVTIGSSASARSFRLTSDLVTTSTTVGVIVVSTDDVVIDLGGFAIRGPGTCGGAPNVCNLTSGTSDGVTVNSTARQGVTVRNGIVAGMAGSGIFIGESGAVIGVTARENRLNGISTGDGSVVRESRAARNGSGGVSTGLGSVIDNVAAFRNTSDGIVTSVGSTVQRSSAYGNGGDGISASSGSIVEGNAARGNDGYGLSLSTSAGYGGNSITTLGGSTGTVLGGTETGGNVCNGSPTCP